MNGIVEISSRLLRHQVAAHRRALNHWTWRVVECVSGAATLECTQCERPVRLRVVER